MRPEGSLILDPSEIKIHAGALWRIHRTTGRHRQHWNDLRDFGPIPTMRWDPHPAPSGHHPASAVSYAATDVVTAFAEAFQNRRAITLSPDQALAGWQPVRPLRLLDLTGSWLLHNRASASLPAGRKDRCRNWSQAIRQTWPDLDGLWVGSTMTGTPMVVLYQPAQNSFPASPQLHRPLDSPVLAGVITQVHNAIGWPVRT
jgi:hypothetical protein